MRVKLLFCILAIISSYYLVLQSFYFHSLFFHLAGFLPYLVTAMIYTTKYRLVRSIFWSAHYPANSLILSVFHRIQRNQSYFSYVLNRTISDSFQRRLCCVYMWISICIGIFSIHIFINFCYSAPVLGHPVQAYNNLENIDH